MGMTKELFNELVKNNSFVEGWAAAETKEDILQLFTDNGVEMTMEEVTELLGNAPDLDENAELSDDTLENVSGGMIVLPIVIRRWGGCGTKCRYCGQINGIFGHVCKPTKWPNGLKRKLGPWIL